MLVYQRVPITIITWFFQPPNCHAKSNPKSGPRQRLLEIISALDAIPLRGVQRRKMGWSANRKVQYIYIYTYMYTYNIVYGWLIYIGYDLRVGKLDDFFFRPNGLKNNWLTKHTEVTISSFRERKIIRNKPTRVVLFIWRCSFWERNHSELATGCAIPNLETRRTGVIGPRTNGSESFSGIQKWFRTSKIFAAMQWKKSCTSSF